MKNMKHRMDEYYADIQRENEYHRELRNYKKLGLYCGIPIILFCGACMITDKPIKDNYQNIPISTNLVTNTNSIDEVVK